MDPFLRRSIFDATGLIYYSNPNASFTAQQEYTGKLIVIKLVQDAQGRDYMFCKPLSTPSKKIYI